MATPLTKRDKNFFQHEGHLFWFTKPSQADASLKFWKCSHYKSSGCPARIHTRDGVVVKTLNDHTHASDPISIEVTKVRNSIKRRANETKVEVRNLFFIIYYSAYVLLSRRRLNLSRTLQLVWTRLFSERCRKMISSEERSNAYAQQSEHRPMPNRSTNWTFPTTTSSTKGANSCWQTQEQRRETHAF